MIIFTIIVGVVFFVVSVQAGLSIEKAGTALAASIVCAIIQYRSSRKADNMVKKAAQREKEAAIRREEAMRSARLNGESPTNTYRFICIESQQLTLHAEYYLTSDYTVSVGDLVAVSDASGPRSAKVVSAETYNEGESMPQPVNSTPNIIGKIV